MATPVSNVSSAQTTAQTTATTTTRSTATTGTTDLFQAALAQATTDSRAAQATASANQATLNAEANAAEADKQTADARAAELAAQLAAQLAATATTTQVPVTQTPTGTTTTQTDSATLASTQTVPPTLSNPLFRQFVSDGVPQGNTARTTALTRTTPTPTPTTTPTATTTPTTTPAPNALPVVPTPAPTTGLSAALAAVQPGQKQVVTAQPLLVPGVNPNQPETGTPTLTTPIVAPEAASAPSALPNVVLGDRPTTAGERFAAIASAAAGLAQAQPQTAAAFANVLAGTTAANATTAPLLSTPTQLGTAERNVNVKDRDFGTAPTSGSSPFANPVSPNAPQPTQTATAVQAPAPAVQVADGIITHAHTVQHGGTTEFHIRLDPPELGAVRIRLTSDGDGINGQVVVSNDAIRRMIESQLPELRQRLEAAGVTVQNFDVTTDPGTGNGNNPNAGTETFRPDPLAEFGRRPVAVAPPPRATASRAPGALDVMA